MGIENRTHECPNCGKLVYAPTRLLCTACRKKEERKVRARNVTLAFDTEECPPHYWILSAPSQRIIDEICKKCGATRTEREVEIINDAINATFRKYEKVA